MTNTKTVISVEKVIQLRVEHTDQTGRTRGYNKRYRSAHAAAEEYTQQRISQWEDKKWQVDIYGAAYHRQTEADQEYIRRLKYRFYRRVVGHFRNILNNV